MPLIAPRVKVIKEKLPHQEKKKHNFPNYLKEYCDNSGIHGMRYLTEKRTILERTFWAFTLLLSLCGCLYIVYQVLEKYEENPVVMSFSNKNTPINKIPFPSVTICPEVKTVKKQFDYSEVYKRLSQNQTVTSRKMMLFQYVNLLCNANRKGLALCQGNKTFGDDFFSVIDKLKPNVLLYCLYMNKWYDCSKLFSPIIIDQGFCYSFNMLDRSELFNEHVVHYKDFHRFEPSKNYTVDYGYTEFDTTTTYPKRALNSGVDNSLDIIVQHSNIDSDYLCTQYLEGFRVSIHNPVNIPRLSKYYFRIPFGKTEVAAVEPKLIITSDDVKAIAPEKRNCYLTTERSLKHFKLYTQSNCLLECLTNHTLGKCGCVSFFMPRDNTTAICGTGSFKCASEAEDEVRYIEWRGGSSFAESEDDTVHCDCRPSCTDLSFSLETSSSSFHWREYLVEEKGIDLDDNYEFSYSVLSVYVKTEQVIAIERNELYGIFDLVSNFGGLLGLFTGFSIISLVEIIYFMTLRIFYNKRLYGFWFGQSMT